MSRHIPGTGGKIPYLKELGINAVELMPIFEFDEMRNARLIDENQLIDYWGYNPVSSLFSQFQLCLQKRKIMKEPSSSISHPHAACQRNRCHPGCGVQSHRRKETNSARVFSFKGFDNNIYYMLTPDGYYYNFSGCGKYT